MIAPLTLIRVVDTETTSLESPEVCEVAWTDVRLFPTGWAIERGPTSQLCSVTCEIEPEAQAEHHISADDLIGQPPFEQVRPMVELGVDFLAAHNAEFDSQFFPDKRIPWICTLKAAAALWPDYPSHKNQALRYRRGYEFADVSKTLPAHRAGPDSFVTAHILVDLLNSTDPKTGERYPIDAFVKVSALPRRWLRIPMGKHRGMLMAEVPASYLDWVVNKSELDETAIWNCRREMERRGIF